MRMSDWSSDVCSSDLTLLSPAAARDSAAACSHCLLPVGRLGQKRSVNGEDRMFCCYGCCIAYQVRHGVSEEHEAAWLLVRLGVRSEEHTSELQSLLRISYAVFCLKQKKNTHTD